MPAPPRRALLLLLSCLCCTAPFAHAETPAPEPVPSTGAPAASSDAAATQDEKKARLLEVNRIQKERGLQVCRLSANGKLRFEGVTQDHQWRKVQILVKKIVNVENGEVVPGMRETNVWDPPENWSLCSS